MRIALVTETYPPEVNGVAMTLQRLCYGLADRKHMIQVIRPRQKQWDVQRIENGIEELPLPGLPLPGYDGLHFGLPAIGTLVENWRSRRPDVVHVATEGPLGWSGIRAAKRLGIPLASSFHTNFHSYGKHYGFGPLQQIALWYLRYIHNATKCTLAPSKDVMDALEKDGFQNVGLLGRGVDTRLFSPAKRDPALRREWGADEQTPVAIYVGRVASEKNIPLTIKAWQTMKGILPSLKLVLVGDGPETRALKHAHPDVIFAGMQRGEALAKHYASGDCFLFASTTETFGNVVTEAMASGLVVLAYDYAAPRQYIKDWENGVKARFDDSDNFLSTARELVTRQPEWNVMRLNARQTALSISWDAVVDSLESRYRKLANKELPTGAALHPSVAG